MKGFTLIELMVSIAIVAILTTIAVPAYRHYTRRARYTEAILALAPYQAAITECIQDLGTREGCNNGKHGIPAEVNSPEGLIAKLTIQDGIITLIPIENYGITAQDDLIATPNLTSGHRVIWTLSGGAINAGYVKS